MKTSVEKHHCAKCGLRWHISKTGTLFLDTLHPGANPTCPEHMAEITKAVAPKKTRKAVKKEDVNASE